MAELILVVEDDASIMRGLLTNLGLEGFRVMGARDGQEAMDMIAQSHPDVILLDLMLPRKGGIEIIRELRLSDPETTIVVVSARDQESDKVLALSLGADDYLAKPFGTAELLARVRAALRRRRISERHLDAGRVSVDVDGRRILVDGNAVDSTAREFDLLMFLLGHPGVAFTREQLMRQVWGSGHFGTVRTVDNFIARLRAKIGDSPEAPRIETVRGIGYRFVP
jgi:DNA-binding response OmpR family regulator